MVTKKGEVIPEEKMLAKNLALKELAEFPNIESTNDNLLGSGSELRKDVTICQGLGKMLAFKLYVK